MFNKAKTFFKNAVSKVKNSLGAVETAVSVRAHAALDGTKAEAYVDSHCRCYRCSPSRSSLCSFQYNHHAEGNPEG